MKKLHNIRQIVVYLRFPLLLVSLYILKNTLLTLSLYNNIFIIQYLILWFITLFLLGIDSNLNFIIALIFFILAAYTRVPTLKHFKDAENFAGWMFFFLTVGVIHQFLIEKFQLETYPLIRIKDALLKDISFLGRIFNQINNLLKKSNNVYISFLYRSILSPYSPYSSIKTHRLRLMTAIRHGNYLLLAKYVAISIFIIFFLLLINHEVQRLLTWQLIQPKIIKVEPTIVYRSNKIILWGRSFGANPQGTVVKVMTNSGSVHKDFWTDTKIYITVPLNWKNGQVKLWVEKPVLWDGHWLMRKSNMVTVKLIPVTEEFTPDDDAYFGQLKYLNKETLRLNGYK